MRETIPVIDLARAAPADSAAELRTACESAGFFYVVGHGVPATLIADQFRWAERFFALPESAKQAIAMHHSPGRRGYEALGAQRLDPGAQPDLKESFYAGLDFSPDHPAVRAGWNGYGVNQWPAALPGFRAQMEAYLTAQLALGDRLYRLLALSLDLPEDWFAEALRDPMARLRLLRYPPAPAMPGQFGAGAHTDFGGLTILAQDDLGGLEVRLPSGEWVAAPPIPGSFVVNLGDLIQRWTNDRYRSNPHRVVHRGGTDRARYSVPFFYTPNWAARIVPVPGCLAPGEPPRHPPCTAGEHMDEMYRRTYGLAA